MYAGLLIATAATILCPTAKAVTLDEAVAAAREHNLDLQLVHARTREAESLMGQARALVQPKVVANSSYTVNEYEIAFDLTESIPPEFASLFPASEPNVIQEKQFWTISTTIQQPLFSGQALPLMSAAKNSVQAARADQAGYETQILAGVVKSYHGLHTAREALRLTERAEQTAARQLDLAKRQVDAGTAPPRAVLQAELGVSRAQRERQDARQRLVSAEEAFRQLTGLDPQVPLETPPPVAAPASVDDALQRAEAERPELRGDQARLRAARNQRAANWAGWLPQVNGRATYVYNGNTPFFDDPTMWMVVFEGQWMLWDGGFRLAQDRAYASQVHQAELAATRRVLGIRAEVREAWERYQRAQAALDAAEHELALATENTRLAKLGFEAGTTTWFEVEQAELGLQAVELARLVERMNREFAAVDLRVASGDRATP